MRIWQITYFKPLAKRDLTADFLPLKDMNLEPVPRKTDNSILARDKYEPLFLRKSYSRDKLGS